MQTVPLRAAYATFVEHGIHIGYLPYLRCPLPKVIPTTRPLHNYRRIELPITDALNVSDHPCTIGFAKEENPRKAVGSSVSTLLPPGVFTLLHGL